MSDNINKWNLDWDFKGFSMKEGIHGIHPYPAILNNEEDPRYDDFKDFLKSCGDEVYDPALIWAKELKKDEKLQNHSFIEVQKNKIKIYFKRKYETIFEQNDIYAKPELDIDGTDIKIFVKTTKRYLINVDDSTVMNSAGYNALLRLLLILNKFKYESDKKINQNFIICADEIEKNIHPLAQRKLIKYIYSELNSKYNNLKIILSTHSPFLILDETDEKNKNYIVSRDKQGFSVVYHERDEDLVSDQIVLEVKDALLKNNLLN